MKFTERYGRKAFVMAMVAISLSAAAQNIAPVPSVTGVASVCSPASAGYAVRGELMLPDDNFVGAADQLEVALRAAQTALTPQERALLDQALAVAHLDGRRAETLLEEFIAEFPASAFRADARLAVANLLFDRKEYARALKTYDMVSPAGLNAVTANLRDYHRAYCLLKMSDFQQAKSAYTALTVCGNSSLANAARFYLGYISYAQGNYRDARQEFLKVVPQGQPTVKTPYYLAQISFLEKDYRKAIEYASRQLNEAGQPGADNDELFIAESSRILGESKYQLGDTQGAVSQLRRYLQQTSQPVASALYILGVDDYNNGMYERAIEELTPATAYDSAMGQSAYLFLGQSYLQSGNYNAATIALDKAARMLHDAQVQEKGFYNLAVAKMQGGKMPFDSSVLMFEEFLQRYPESELAPRVADYVITGYITDNNYQAALDAINRIARPSDKVLEAKQKVQYSLGARQLQAGQTAQAVANLTAAANARYDAETQAEASLWLGEALYRQGNYAQAVNSYNRYLASSAAKKENKPLAYYDLGYALYAGENFGKAATAFENFLASTPKSTAKTTLADAYNRLADCQYYQSKFSEAAKTYSKAYDQNPSAGDYSIYQQAIMKGLQRDYNGKIATLQQMSELFPGSSLQPSALLEMGEAYSELGERERAVETYTALVTRYPATAQGRKGRLLLAMTYLNNGNRSQAIAHYKKVITEYPSSEEAQVAADDLKEIYADMGQVGKYVEFIQSVPNAPKPETAEIARLTLQSAERALEDGRDDDAYRAACEVVETYPDSPQATAALAIKADADFRRGNNQEALAAYRQLENSASNSADIQTALLGIMRVSHDAGNNAEALEAADKLLASSSLGAFHSEVLFTKALALKAMARNKEAAEIWTTLSADTDDLYGAKSAYYLAQYYYDNGDTRNARKTVDALIDSNTPHEYWLARGFIVLSDILRKSGDTFQADEYLRSLRENYPGSEADIFKMIDDRLK